MSRLVRVSQGGFVGALLFLLVVWVVDGRAESPAGGAEVSEAVEIPLARETTSVTTHKAEAEADAFIKALDVELRSTELSWKLSVLKWRMNRCYDLRDKGIVKDECKFYFELRDNTSDDSGVSDETNN